MSRIRLTIAPSPWETGEDRPQERRSPYDVTGLADEGASPRGSTFYKSLFTCPREFAYRYILGFKAINPSEALAVGWLFHKVLEFYYKAIQEHQQTAEKPRKPLSTATRLAWENYWWGGSAEAVQQALAPVMDPIRDEPGYKETFETLERLSSHYFDTYWKTDRWDIIAVEETIEYDGREEKNPALRFEYSARLDLIVYDHVKQGLVVVEHKSARYLTKDLIDNYQQDIQILGQLWLLKNCVDLTQYPPLKGTFVDIITKQTTPKSDRVPANPSDFHIEAFRESVASWSRLYKYLEAEGWPRALGKCAGAPRGYSKCEFYDLCHGHPYMGVKDWKKAGPPVGFATKDESET